MHLRWDAVRLARSAALTSPQPVINPSGRTTPSNALRPTANTETPTKATQLNHIRLRGTLYAHLICRLQWLYVRICDPQALLFLQVVRFLEHCLEISRLRANGQHGVREYVRG